MIDGVVCSSVEELETAVLVLTDHLIADFEARVVRDGRCGAAERIVLEPDPIVSEVIAEEHGVELAVADVLDVAPPHVEIVEPLWFLSANVVGLLAEIEG